MSFSEKFPEIFDVFCVQYKITALWSSTDDDSEPLDREHSCYDLTVNCAFQMHADCDQFLDECEKLGLNEGWGLDDYSQAGHDFWLTRNGHGAGFWDGDWEKPLGMKLTELSKRFGEVFLYVNDENLIDC